MSGLDFLASESFISCTSIFLIQIILKEIILPSFLVLLPGSHQILSRIRQMQNDPDLIEFGYAILIPLHAIR